MTRTATIIFSFFFFGNIAVGSSQILKKHRDSIDGAIDLSHFLKDLNGVLPVLSPITEPAVGFGLAGAALYFIPKEKKSGEQYIKSDIAALAGGFTENGTWFAGGGYFGFWNDDTIRYKGVFGYGDVNLEYYGELQHDIPRNFNLTSYVFFQQAIFRIKESNVFIGGKYLLTKTSVEFNSILDLPEIPDRKFDLLNSGISAITEFDNLDNIFSPTKGVKIHLSYDQNLEVLGSDRNWGKLDFYSLIYYPIKKTWIPALRIASQIATGDIPFYAKPYIDLRGVPALRYQGDVTYLVETEQLVNISSRWGIVGFAGLGNTYNNHERFNDSELVWNAGGGFRYLLARIFGLKMGLDIAKGPEDWAVYVVFGSSWLR